MSDLDKEFEAKNDMLLDSCLKVMTKALAVKKHKDTNLKTRRAIEDKLEFIRMRDEGVLGG